MYVWSIPPEEWATGGRDRQREGTGLAAGTGGIRADPAGGAMRAWGDWLDDHEHDAASGSTRARSS